MSLDSNAPEIPPDAGGAAEASPRLPEPGRSPQPVPSIEMEGVWTRGDDSDLGMYYARRY